MQNIQQIRECYNCHEKITSENETEEHIIINAAGGRLKSKNLICKNCNSKFGQTIDASLAKQINTLTNFLMIKRKRGSAPPILATREKTGERFHLEVGGTPVRSKPIFLKIENGDKSRISITARNPSELKEMLHGLAAKYPQINIQEAMKIAKLRNEFIEDGLIVETEVGGKEVFRAVCKCAINFFLLNDGDSSTIKHLIPYLSGEVDMDVVWMHYQDNLYELAKEESSHIIHLVGDGEKGILYCYVDYFNAYKYIVLLNTDYSGKSITETYCFDLIKSTTIPKRISMTYSRETVLNFLIQKDINLFDKVTKAFDHSILIGLQRQEEYQRSLTIEKVFKDYMSRLPVGTSVSKEMLDDIMTEIAKPLAAYITRTNTN